MLKRFIQLAVFSAFLLSSCNTDGLPTNTAAPAKGSLPTLAGAWTIKMVHSGGIMGLMRSIEVNSTGSYTVRDERGNKNLTGQLSETEIANLIQMVNSTQYAQNTIPGACADCFIYDIEINSNGANFSAHVDDISIEASGLQPLVTTLRNLIERELKY